MSFGSSPSKLRVGSGIQGALIAGAGVTLLLGFFSTSPLGYYGVTIPALLAPLLWLVGGARGIPTLPTVAVLYYVYYALPLLRDTQKNYSPAELDTAGITVGIFLIAATVGWAIFGQKREKTRGAYRELPVSPKSLVVFTTAGLLSGILFLAATHAGLTALLGTFIGLVRAVCLSFASISSYFLGFGLGRRMLVGRAKSITLSLFLLLLLMNVAGLFLYQAAYMFCGATLGYVITARKVPIRILTAALVILTVLNAGKNDMRLRYWAYTNHEAVETSVFDIPEFVIDWIGVGVSNLASGKVSEDTALERASLLQMVLLVQHMTPQFVPYLDGETYAKFSSILLPRFVNENKASSQSSINLLSVRYGLQTEEGTTSTTLAWGPVAEAFANFGLAGVLFAGLFFGVLNGIIMRWSIGAPPLSVPALLAISAMTNLFNVESDLSFMMLNILQSLISVSIVGFAMKALRKADRASSPRPADLPNVRI